MNLKTALIIGVSGQDGAYLAHYLLSLGYRVIGSSRDAQVASWASLKRLGILKEIDLVSLAPSDFRSVLKCLKEHKPDEIYNLSGQTSVALSFDQPVECIDSILTSNINILESIRILQLDCKFFCAGSSESFGSSQLDSCNELSPMFPCSPYGAAKAAATWNIKIYRDAYGLFACTGILSNHESPLRPERFVTQKVVQCAKRIKAGEISHISLGDLSIARDWGWAPQYVQAMHLMLQAEKANDYIVASGTSHKLEKFVQLCFEKLDMNWRDHVKTDESFVRPSEVKATRLTPRKINEELGWKSNVTIDKIIEKMINEELF